MTAIVAGIFGGGSLAVVAASVNQQNGVAGQPPERASASAPVVAEEPEVFANLRGKIVRGSGGEKVGEIADLIVDVRAGKIPYVLVASRPTPGAGYRLRLVPPGALQPARREGDFAVPFDGAAWRELESIDASELDAGALRAFEEQREQIAGVFGLSEPGAGSSRLVLATHLRGKTVRNERETIGRVEAILASPDRRTAMALVKSSHAREVRSFVVPLARLQLPSFGADHFTTTLTRRDLEAGHAVGVDVTAALAATTELERIVGAPGLSQSSVSGQVAYSSSATAPAATPDAPPIAEAVPRAPVGRHEDEQLTPTGSSGDRAGEEKVEKALAAVREAITRDSSLPAANIQVEVADGRLVLQGAVTTAAVRDRVQRIAEQSAPGAEIENRIIFDAR